MEFFKEKKSGFTLVEIVLSMTVFIVFISIVVTSYASLTKSQKLVNDYRKLYTTSRFVFDQFALEARENYLYFGDNQVSDFSVGVSSLSFLTKDEDVLKTFYLEDGIVYLEENKNCGLDLEVLDLNEDGVFVEELSFYVTPVFDPYLDENVSFNSLQFQPKVSVFMTLVDSENNVSQDFQTTISLRSYVETPYYDSICLSKN